MCVTIHDVPTEPLSFQRWRRFKVGVGSTLASVQRRQKCRRTGVLLMGLDRDLYYSSRVWILNGLVSNDANKLLVYVTIKVGCNGYSL